MTTDHSVAHDSDCDAVLGRAMTAAVAGRDRGLMLHPVVVIAVFALLFNDHWWKGRGPVPITGKLSDVAGAVVLTALALTAADLFRTRLGSRPSSQRHRLIIGAAVVAIAALAKLTTGGGAVAGWILGLMRWPIDLVVARSWNAPAPATVIADPGDVLAVALGVGLVLCLGVRSYLPARSVRARCKAPTSAERVVAPSGAVTRVG